MFLIRNTPQGLFTPQWFKFVTKNPQILEPVNKTFQTIDINADGYDDLIFGCAAGISFPDNLISGGTLTYSVYISNGTSFSTSYAVVPKNDGDYPIPVDPTSAVIADVNGDRIPELVVYTRASTLQRYL